MAAAIIWSLAIFLGLWALAFLRARLWIWTAIAAVGLALYSVTMGVPVIGWIVFGILAIVLNVRPLRRALIGNRLFAWFRKVLPPISQTERIALDAGNTWWDGDLFSGRPEWNKLLANPAPVLTAEEQAFLDGPVEELCSVLDDWKITHELNDLPPEAWALIRKHRFFGMIIPKEHGGHGFSALAHSTAVMKISTRSLSAAVTVMVPNSLGPGELLLHYGSDEQKQHYLPRLATAEEIPCFALTSPVAGSDAGAIPDHGVVCKGEYDGKETLGFRVSWEKRYITLGPVATVLGVAFKAYDPDHLLGDKENLGITLALIPTSMPGVEIGNRHYPLNASFQNGPTTGKDVFIPMDHLIGGDRWIGQGWRMLMNCLSTGRAISLPALGTGAGKVASRATGAYSRIRKQFRMPIAKFEGVEEALARIAGTSYRMDAARRMTAGALDQGERPSVLSAILKYHCTEGMRLALNDAMDVHGGRGVMMGPRNYLARAYEAVPISITVEGANILTRSMIIFGQGAIRCHPFLLTEMEAAANPDAEAGANDFDKALFSHIGFTISNAARAFAGALTGSRCFKAPDAGKASGYYRQLSRMSAAFAFSADVALLLLGGKMKRKEKLSGRFGDVLSHLYMASAVLKGFEDQGRPAADLPLVEWALADSLYAMQDRLEAICRNFPSKPLGWLVKFIVMPLGRSYTPPGDDLGHRVADIITSPGAARDRLTRGIYVNKVADDPLGRLELALDTVLAAEPIEKRLEKELKVRLNSTNYEQHVQTALERGVIKEEEAELIRAAAEATRDCILVDEFPPEAGNRAAALGEPATAVESA
ncbi:MAG TPA: acyl-CoA dehydrogenase [Gammaproteobacteria bacterium]|nr:acyl-CoA dehydrogenase [Gammaproteobacteria bacterium]